MDNKLQSNDVVDRWKTMIDETSPAGLVELDDLDSYLGAGTTIVCSGGCSNVSSACCGC